MIKKLFTADQFTPTQWDTAEDKLWFARHFVKFVESGYKRTLFTKKFYTRLSNTFGHIAHYNIDGFYSTFFTDLLGQLDFAKATLMGGGWGDAKFTYSDVERVLKTWAIQTDMQSKAQHRLNNGIEIVERAELKRLQEKYK